MLLKNIKLLLGAAAGFFLLSALRSGFHEPYWLSATLKLLLSFGFGMGVVVIWEKIGKTVWQDWKNLHNN